MSLPKSLKNKFSSCRFHSYILTFLTLSQLLLPGLAESAMTLDRIIVYFEPTESRLQDITVFNPDPENLYLKTDVLKVINPGEPDEQRVAPASTDEVQLLVTPHQTVMPPNTRRVFRLYSRSGPQNTEMVFRVLFVPEVGAIKEGQRGVKILLSYEVLVFVRPQNPHHKLETKRRGDTILFTNSGNTNVLLRNGKYCSNAQKADCMDKTVSQRIYPGQTWKLDVPAGYIFQVGLFDGYKENTHLYDPQTIAPVTDTLRRRGPAPAQAR